MKMKMSLGEGGIKGFFARHVEKIIFALAVLLVIWVALPSSQHKPVGENLSPKQLDESVNMANRHLDEDQWATIQKIRFSAPDDYPGKIPQNPVAAASYLADVPLNKPLFPSAKKRTDVDLYPPVKLQIAVAYGPVVENAKKAAGADDEPEEEVKGRPLPAKLQRKYQNSVTAGEDTKTAGRYIVAILGLVPYKAQKEEFKARFADSTSYMAERDTPKYGAGPEQTFGRFYYMVERAEVAPDGVPGKFAPIGSPKIAAAVQKQWPASGPESELADPMAVDARFAMAVPPLLLRDLQPLAVHSDIRTAAQVREAVDSTQGTETEEEPDDGSDTFDPLAGPSTEPTSPSTTSPTTRPSTGPAHGTGQGRTGVGIGAGPQASSGPYQTAEDVEFKQFRYFDLTAEPGKSYVYRVKMYLEDPNDPEDPKLRPPTASLDKSVIERLARKPDPKIWWRESPYSETSPVARIPATRQVLAGKVDPGKVISRKGEQFSIRHQEETAKIMPLVWDEGKAMDVPAELEVSRGSVANFKTDTEAVDSGRRLLVQLPEYSFQTDALVLDLRGGEDLGNNKTVTVPGEILLLDADGKLIVRNELEDSETYQDHIFPAETKASTGDLPMPEDDKDDRRRPPRGGAGPTPPDRPERPERPTRPPRTRPGSDEGNILN